ncbi:MAG: tRNA (guanine-N7-)-methyltransferase [Saprospiraceae bacterium]|jgi:tRNA (guanine-N7-)-methyltransferase
MSGKKKLIRFAELSELPNVYQNYNIQEPALTNCNQDEIDLKGKWKEVHFQNDNPITLELACGGGEYTVALAERYPNRNFIGLDIKGARIWKGAKKALDNGLDNLAFCRIRIEQLNYFFGENEIDEIWITFPDPFYKKVRRRLTHPNFLKIYKNVLNENGLVHLKTDDDMLFEFTMETLKEEQLPVIHSDNDIYSKSLYHNDLEVKTYYENKHLRNQKTIKYVKFHF